MTRTSLVLLALFSLLSLPLAALAQEDAVPVEDPAPEEAPTQEADLESATTPAPDSNAMTLRLDDVVARGIENNLALQVERFDPLIAYEGRESSWGAFDPTVSVNGGYGISHEPNTNAITGGGGGGQRNKSETVDGGATLSGLVPWLGASLELDYVTSDLDTESFGGFAALQPVYESGLKLTATMPLLKGLVWNDPWTRVKTSESQYRGSEENFRSQLMDVVQFIETNYWNLVATKQSVRVAEKSLETARSLLDQTQTQYDVGVKSKVEVVEAEAGVAARDFDLIRAVNRYRAAQDNLIDAVLGTQLTAGSHIEIVPADDPENYVEYNIDPAEAAEKAFLKRPELGVAQREIERQEYELKFAKNQRLPQLDVIGTYGVSGTRGDDVETPSPFGGGPRSSAFDGDYGDTYSDWFDDKQGGDEYSIRGVISIPLGNISGRHTVSMRALELRKARTSLMQLRQRIILEVRDGARNLKSAQEGIRASERRRIAAEEQLRAEKVRLEYGESTPFKVLEKEEDLVEAENEKIAALFTYRSSVVELHRAQGTILEARNIVVEDAASLR